MQNASKPSVESLLPLKPRVFVILAILNDGACHGYGILKQMAERTDGEMKMDAGLLYRTLARLSKQGVVRDAPEHVDPHDARRRYYELTDFGAEVLAAEAQRQSRLLGTLAIADGGPSRQ